MRLVDARDPSPGHGYTQVPDTFNRHVAPRSQPSLDPQPGLPLGLAIVVIVVTIARGENNKG